MIENQHNEPIEEQGIDFIAIIKRFWEKKWFIIVITACFMFLGTFVAIFSPKVYTSSCTFVPQASKKGGGGSLSSLAAMAGINLGDMTSSENLSPNLYPKVLENIDFMKDLMYSKIKFSEWEEPIAIIDYYTKDEYKKVNPIGVVMKYTIGLPGLIIKSIRGEDSTKVDFAGESQYKYYTKDEYNTAKILSEKIDMTLEEKKGFITITANMPEALAATQLCQITFDLLQKYVTKFKISKAQAQMEFIKGRYEETKADYQAAQIALAEFQDANRAISSATARTELERLSSEYNLANTIFMEMAKQLLQADIQVKEDTPVLAVVKPAAVPYKKSKPQRVKILFIWTFLGGILGCGLVVGFDWLATKGINYPKRWKAPEEFYL